TGAIQLPDERHQRMSGLREAGPDGGENDVLEMRLGDDLASGFHGNDAELGLRLRERGFDVEPRLEARGLGEERADARVLDAKRGRLLKHGSRASPRRSRTRARCSRRRSSLARPPPRRRESPPGAPPTGGTWTRCGGSRS